MKSSPHDVARAAGVRQRLVRGAAGAAQDHDLDVAAVAQDAERIFCTLADKREVDAKLIGTDPAGHERSLPRVPLRDARVLVVIVGRAAAGFVNTSLREIVAPVERSKLMLPASPTALSPVTSVRTLSLRLTSQDESRAIV